MVLAAAAILLAAASAPRTQGAARDRDEAAIRDVQVRFLAPEFAVAHVRWSMTGARTPPGIPEPRQGIQTQVLHKATGRWLIAAFQNTNAVPEMPFPSGPPAPSPAPPPQH